MAAQEPLTALLPVRNGDPTVGHAIEDLLAGMSGDDELLVIDDGSQDATPALLDAIAREDTRVRVVTTSGIGLVRALNLGLRESSHRWVARADADDRYPPSRLPSQRAAVTDGAVLVTADYRVVSGGRPLGELPCALTHPFVVASLVHPVRVPHPGVLYDRDAVLAAGGYLEDDFPAEDLALWLRLAHHGTFVGAPAISVDWTMAPTSISHSNQASQRIKTTELLQSSLPLGLFANLTSSDVERELAAYSGNRLEGQRRVLLARDLRALASLGVARSAYRAAFRALAISPLQTLTAATSVKRAKRRRDQARANFRP